MKRRQTQENKSAAYLLFIKIFLDQMELYVFDG